MISLQYLEDATSSNQANSQKYLEGINAAIARFEIDTHNRLSAFLATVAIESAHLTAVEEGLYYPTPNRLFAIFPRAFHSVDEAVPFTRNPSALSQKLYEGFHGRGLIQLTWKANYLACSHALGEDFIANPALLTQPMWAALSAGWFWATHGCNEAADRGSMEEVTLYVNGKAKMALKERQDQFAIALMTPESA